MPTGCLRVSSVVPGRVPTKGEQRTERQGLLEVAHRRHLSEAAGRHELARERSQEGITLLMVSWQIGAAVPEFVFHP